LFNPNPQRISNWLYRQLHVHTKPSGNECRSDALDAFLWSETNFLLSGKSCARR